MKKIGITLLLSFILVVAPTQKSHAFVWVIVKAAIKKIINAIDLQIQRQQNKVIWAQNLQKELENALSKFKLDEISDWTNKQKEQYQKYFDELQQVKSYITYYQRIKEISATQAKLYREYQRAWSITSSDSHFTPEHLTYIHKVYTGIINESIANIDQITTVLTSLKTQMTDQKRLEIINQAANKIDENYSDLRQFNAENAIYSIQKAKDQGEVNVLKSLYGLN